MTNADFLRRTGPAGPPPVFEVRKTFWGYVVKGTGGPPMMLQVAQRVVLAFGAAFTAGALLLVLDQDSNGAGSTP